MWRLFTSSILLLATLAAAAPSPKQFSVPGPKIDVEVARGSVRLPASQVPAMQLGDMLFISFPKGIQFSRNPRWHMIVATLYDDYLQHPPAFAIADADLSRAPAGYVWSVPYNPEGTPVIFLVPEDGGRHGRGMPDARAAIDDMRNRALLLRTAKLSAGAAVRASTMDEFLRSLSTIQPGELADGRARVESASQQLFGYDLGDASCFTPGIVQSTQYACAAAAMVQGYNSPQKISAVAAVGAQLSVNTATYGMLIGALYSLLAKRRIAAHYIFIPGVVKPGGSNAEVYVDQPVSYDATAAKPSTIVYFTIGSQELNGNAAGYGPAPKLPVCLDGDKLQVNVPFSGLPVYFRAHAFEIRAASTTFQLPATYDPLAGYSASLNAAQRAAVAGGAAATIESQWGFSQFTSPAISLITAHPAVWTAQPSATLISGSDDETLTLSDGGAGMGSCVHSVQVTDSIGRALPVTKFVRERDTLTATIDATNALGPTASAVVTENGEAASAPASIALLPAMPQITSATAYLPHGTLVLRGSGLKYIDTVTLERTGIAFGDGQPNGDGSWTFTATTRTAYQPKWLHETMAISYTLMPPDTRASATAADVDYEP